MSRSGPTRAGVAGRRTVPLLLAAAVVVAGCSGTAATAPGGASSTGTSAGGTSAGATTTARPNPAPTATAADTAGWGTPSWSDEFTGSSVRRGWAVYDSDGNDGTGLRRPSQVGVADGVLTQTSTTDAVTAGMVLRGHDETSGRWEVRVRSDVAPGAGTRPVVQVALLPVGAPDPADRVLTLFSHEPGTGTGRFFLHFPPRRQDYASASIDAAAWHTVAVEVAPGHVTWFVDGQPQVTDVSPGAQPVTPMRLGIQLDAAAPGAMLPGRLQVDWVRHYPLGSAPVPVPPAPGPEVGDAAPPS